MATALPAGSIAPDFTLPQASDRKLTLSKLRGRNVVLVFYPADWSPVCTDELGIYSQICGDFDALHAVVLGISVDGVWCHAAFAKERKLRFPLLADFHPKGAVARAYGVYREDEGVSERALFVIDREGRIVWSYVSPLGVNPGADDVLDVLERIEGKQTQEGATP